MIQVHPASKFGFGHKDGIIHSEKVSLTAHASDRAAESFFYR